jgi:hypothetical protein
VIDARQTGRFTHTGASIGGKLCTVNTGRVRADYLIAVEVVEPGRRTKGVEW